MNRTDDSTENNQQARSERISTSVTEEEKEKFRLWAAVEGRSMSDIIQDMVSDYLEERGDPPGWDDDK